jgi:hypothetical protein
MQMNPNDAPPYVGSILCLAHLMALGLHFGVESAKDSKGAI